MFNVIAEFEGQDSEFYNEIAAEKADLGVWEVDECSARCTMQFPDMGSMVRVLLENDTDFTDEELAEIANNETTIIEQGRGVHFTVVNKTL